MMIQYAAANAKVVSNMLLVCVIVCGYVCWIVCNIVSQATMYSPHLNLGVCVKTKFCVSLSL